ncbi:MAG: hypothetical protein H7067_15735 [Burkholderiales bacterium]|nr:hypothetical protein [Opitutaceae bacterium]
MPNRLALLAVASLIATALSSPANASGSYPPNPPRLGVAALAKIDAEAYNLGKTLFIDRLALPDTAPPGADPADNLARLEAVQGLLPERVRSEVDLPALAPRLDSAQVDALLYYVGLRFRIQPPAATPKPAA